MGNDLATIWAKIYKPVVKSDKPIANKFKNFSRFVDD